MSLPKVEIIKKPDLIQNETIEEPQIIQINDNANPVDIFSGVEIVGLKDANVHQTKIDLNSSIERMSVNPGSIKIKIGNNIISKDRPISQVSSEPSSSHQTTTEEDTGNVFLIPPLLRIRHYATEERIPISINEIRRRIGPPESLSQTLILNLLRLNKERAKHLRKALGQFGIKELSPKSAVVSSFSKLTEAEATALAEDYYYLASRFMKVEEMHNSLEDQNGGAEILSSKAAMTRLILEQVLTEIESKDSDLNSLTHGFSPLMLRGVFNILIEILTFKERVTQEMTLGMAKDEPCL